MNNLPKHIAFIMDGNGRWAQLRNMPRTYGHKKGLDTVEVVLDYCIKLGIECVSLYVFSTENWHRPQEEVNALFDLAEKYLTRFDKFCQKGIRVVVSGELSGLTKKLQKSIIEIQQKTKNADRMTVNLCINYGGRQEIISAVNKALSMNLTEVTDDSFAKLLYNDLPYPDLIVRTGGYMRLSNFLMYQSAYSELYFTDTLWPDYGERDIDIALEIYKSRQRNFGGIK